MSVEEQLQIEQEIVAKDIVRSFEDVESIKIDERNYTQEMGTVYYSVIVNGHSKVRVTEASGDMEQVSLSYDVDQMHLTEIPISEYEDIESVSLDDVSVDYLTEEEIENDE